MAVMVIAGPVPACIIRMPAFDGNGNWKLVSEPVVSASDFLLAGGDPKRENIIRKQIVKLPFDRLYYTHAGI